MTLTNVNRPIRLLLLAISGLFLASCDPIDTVADIIAPTPEATHQFVLQADLEGIDLGDDPDARLKQLLADSQEALLMRLTISDVLPLELRPKGDGKLVIIMSGERSPEVVKAAIDSRGDLALRMVNMEALPQNTAQGIAPPGSEILPMAGGDGKLAVLRIGGISGRYIRDARLVANAQTGDPSIAIQFDEKGGRRLAMLTSENVNKPMAIVLDGSVLSTPIIAEPILGGQVEISGGFTASSAQALAAKLRSGPLPLNFELVDVRAIGPDS